MGNGFSLKFNYLNCKIYLDSLAKKTKNEYERSAILSFKEWLRPDPNIVVYWEHGQMSLVGKITAETYEKYKGRYCIDGICTDGRQWWTNPYWPNLESIQSDDLGIPEWAKKIPKEILITHFVLKAAQSILLGSLSHRNAVDMALYPYK